MGKSCKLPFKESNKREVEPLKKIHSNLWGPAPVTSSQGIKYYVIFVDDWTRFTWFYALKKKSDFSLYFYSFSKISQKSVFQEAQSISM